MSPEIHMGISYPQCDCIEEVGPLEGNSFMGVETS